MGNLVLPSIGIPRVESRKPIHTLSVTTILYIVNNCSMIPNNLRFHKMLVHIVQIN